MDKQNQSIDRYQPYAGKDVSVQDNTIDTTEFILRDALLHAYESGYRRNHPPLVALIELFAGAALAMLCDGIITIVNQGNPSMHFALCSAFLFACVGSFFKHRLDSTRTPMERDRDTCIDTQIQSLMEKTRPFLSHDGVDQPAKAVPDQKTDHHKNSRTDIL